MATTRTSSDDRFTQRVLTLFGGRTLTERQEGLIAEGPWMLWGGKYKKRGRRKPPERPIEPWEFWRIRGLS